MNIKGQGHSLTLIQDHSDSASFFFSLETVKPIEAKFHLYPPWDEGTKGFFKMSRSHDQYGRHAHIW